MIVSFLLRVILLANVQAHPPLGAGASAENGVEAESTIDAAEQGGSLRLDGASCSFSSVLAEIVGNHATPQNTKAVAAAAKEAGGIVVVRHTLDAQMMRNVYGVEAIALSEIKKADGKMMFWESGAIYDLAMQLVNVTNKGNRRADG